MLLMEVWLQYFVLLYEDLIERYTNNQLSSIDDPITDPVAAAKEIAFCKACARFGLGLYLYQEE